MRGKFVSGFVLFAAFGLAGQPCPWMNAATAEGSLGGKIDAVKVTAKSGDDAACFFESRNGPVVAKLEIETEMNGSFAGRCRSEAAPLKAIGTSAAACAGDDHSEMVVGRVRDRAFLVRIRTTDRSVKSADLRETARKLAEQVAGILF